MNEFTAKKLGEILAFTEVGFETLSKGKNVFESTFGAEKVAHIKKMLLTQKDSIHTLADRAGTLKVVLDKFEKTAEKLVKMRDLYVENGWESSLELLEWFGFFEGGIVTHSSILQGAALEMSHSELKGIADQCLAFHRELLEGITTLLHLIGRQKASS